MYQYSNTYDCLVCLWIKRTHLLIQLLLDPLRERWPRQLTVEKQRNGSAIIQPGEQASGASLSPDLEREVASGTVAKGLHIRVQHQLLEQVHCSFWYRDDIFLVKFVIFIIIGHSELIF